MSKIKVTICLGTACFVMGGSKYQELPEMLNEKYGDKVDVESSICLDLCRNNKYSKSPYVLVDDEVVSEATKEKVINAIEKKINEH